MKKPVQSLSWMIIPITLAVTTSGCATKKYVQAQTGVVNQRVSKLETKTNQQMAAMRAKERADISRVDERVTTADNRVAQLTNATQQANTTASQANQMAQANQAKIDATAKGLDAVATYAQNAGNFQLIEKGDVTFGFNKSDLDDDARIALDLIIQKAKAMPRAVVEVDGFADKVGSPQYNLALSRRRADAVARYLVRQDIPLRNITVIGLGEEEPPASLRADLKAVDPNAPPAEVRRLARRVVVRVYAPVTSIAGEAARTEPEP